MTITDVCKRVLQFFYEHGIPDIADRKVYIELMIDLNQVVDRYDTREDVLRDVAALPLFHGKCDCRYCAALRGAREVIDDGEGRAET